MSIMLLFDYKCKAEGWEAIVTLTPYAPEECSQLRIQYTGTAHASCDFVPRVSAEVNNREF